MYLLILLLHFAFGQTIEFMPVGKVFTLSLKQPITISNKRVLQAREVENKIIVIAKKTGRSDFQQRGKKKRTFQVVSQRVYRQLKLMTLSSHCEDLQWEVIGKDLEVSGQLTQLRCWKKLIQIAQRHRVPYRFAADIPRALERAVSHWLRQFLAERGLTLSKVSYKGGLQVIVEPLARNQRKILNNVFRTLGVKPEISVTKFLPTPNVEILLEFVELSRSFAREFGFSWPGNWDSNVYSEMKKNLVFKALQSEGTGKILARSTLTAKHGSEVHFHSGGEVPIRYSGYKNSGVTWKKYGLRIDLKPQVAPSWINLEIDTELSYLDESATADGIPGLKNTVFKTHRQLRPNNSVVLTGLSHAVRSHSSQGVPWVTQIPLLQLFFSESRKRDQDSEFMIFITPRIIK